MILTRMNSLFQFKSRIPLYSTAIQNKVRYASAAEVFKKHQVVPDIISVPPKELCEVTYPSGVTVDGGFPLTPTNVRDPPTVHYTADASSYHVLCLTDPDSPSRGRPTFREWHHWLVGNIPGDNVGQGEVLSAYISPCPPKTSGKHRYVFLVYKQGGKLEFDEKRLPSNRTSFREKFHISEFAAKYNLGDPIAGNLFLAEWDPFVDLFYAKLAKR